MDYKKIIENMFSPEFTKTANGNELVSNRNGLEQQLIDVKNMVNTWEVHETFIIPSADAQKCTFRYKLETDKAGTFDVLAVMESKDGTLIDNIDEIYYQQSAE